MSESIELSQVYTADWFRRRERYRPVYHAFARAIEDVFHPTSILDVGCGAGYLLEYFINGGIDCRGVDGSPAALAALRPDIRARCYRVDLGLRPASPDPDIAVDLAVCVEVAEHIPEPLLPVCLSWFSAARRLLLTAAPPGQRGNHHVNCRPPYYWIGALAAIGFRHDGPLTEKWKARAHGLTSGCPWVVRNALYFERYP